MLPHVLLLVGVTPLIIVNISDNHLFKLIKALLVDETRFCANGRGTVNFGHGEEAGPEDGLHAANISHRDTA